MSNERTPAEVWPLASYLYDELDQGSPDMAKIENVERNPFPPDAIKRLGEADKAISAMTPEERRAAFDWMKSKYAAEWPYSS